MAPMIVMAELLPTVTTFDGDAPCQRDLQRLGRLQYVVVERFDLNRSSCSVPREFSLALLRREVVLVSAPGCRNPPPCSRSPRACY